MSNDFEIKDNKSNTLFYCGGRGYNQLMRLLDEAPGDIPDEDWERIKIFTEEGINYDEGYMANAAMAFGYSEEDIESWGSHEKDTFTYQQTKDAFDTFLRLLETCQDSEDKEWAIDSLSASLDALDEIDSNLTFSSHYS